jgi:hypothetical protein
VGALVAQVVVFLGHHTSEVEVLGCLVGRTWVEATLVCLTHHRFGEVGLKDSHFGP